MYAVWFWSNLVMRQSLVSGGGPKVASKEKIGQISLENSSETTLLYSWNEGRGIYCSTRSQIVCLMIQSSTHLLFSTQGLVMIILPSWADNSSRRCVILFYSMGKASIGMLKLIKITFKHLQDCIFEWFHCICGVKLHNLLKERNDNHIYCSWAYVVA